MEQKIKARNQYKKIPFQRKLKRYFFVLKLNVPINL